MTQKTPPVCDYEGSDYQKSFWDEGGRAYEDKAEEIALKRLLPKSGKLLLEIGAGAGRNTPRYKGYERIVLLDYSRTQLQQAQERLGESERYIYVAADAYKLPFVDGLFDGATMIRTLHHMKDAPAAIQQVRRILESSGNFILEYANKLNLKAILRYFLRKQEWSPFTPEQVEFVALNFDFHPKTIRKWLEKSNFRLERQLTVSHFRIAIIKRFFPAIFLAKMDSIAQLTGDWWQLTPSVFTISEAVGESPVASEGAFFQCPQCGSTSLKEEPEMLSCSNCDAKYAIRNGIYDFREPLT
ncbi:MAG: class I SAM-dependent methyltransferase [Anaerolineae bacterium]|jgi:ubiquinone/menaquinone biosynthesis C-methylase UbiE|nr:class I SAM-dependent methyltransferase [Anaerolineae bacterium]MBT7076058.1 class I SAM-dependent methyltransferase [Anaerolineae bacterium]MBT7782664.1 class I SAM-dependent methyltransferase [Anaerolineae bacterium]